MRDEKGITLIMLVITVILTLIIAVTAAYSGISTYKGMKVKTFSESLKVVKERVNVVKEKANTNSELNIFELGKEISEESLGKETYSKVANSILNSGEDEALEKYRYFDKSTLNSDLSLDIDNQEYAIDFENSTVIGLRGVEYEGRIVYTQKQIDDVNNSK